jgi:hypothetical protein
MNLATVTHHHSRAQHRAGMDVGLFPHAGGGVDMGGGRNAQLGPRRLRPIFGEYLEEGVERVGDRDQHRGHTLQLGVSGELLLNEARPGAGIFHPAEVLLVDGIGDFARPSVRERVGIVNVAGLTRDNSPLNKAGQFQQWACGHQRESFPRNLLEEFFPGLQEQSGRERRAQRGGLEQANRDILCGKLRQLSWGPSG